MIEQKYVDRFWSRVDKTSSPNGCWLWTAGKTGGGYGFLSMRHVNYYTHRISFEIYHGRPPRQHVLHHCDTPACVNPDHLYEGDQKANAQDAARRKRFPWLRRTRCKHGHDLAGDNFYLSPTRGGGVQRVCKTCKKEWDKHHKERDPEAFRRKKAEWIRKKRAALRGVS